MKNKLRKKVINHAYFKLEEKANASAKRIKTVLSTL